MRTQGRDVADTVQAKLVELGLLQLDASRGGWEFTQQGARAILGHPGRPQNELAWWQGAQSARHPRQKLGSDVGVETGATASRSALSE